MTKKVRAIGIDPAWLDFSAMPQFSPEMFRRYIDDQLDRIRALGYDAATDNACFSSHSTPRQFLGSKRSLLASWAGGGALNIGFANNPVLS